MEKVFGLPAGPLAVALTGLLAAGGAAIGLLAVRNRVFLKMGIRNIPRRRGRTALIVTGLMLGTAILASALLTGDTMSRTVRAAVTESLGPTDETVTAGGRAAVAGNADVDAAEPYFEAAGALAAIDGAASTLPIDGVLAAIIEPVAAQHVEKGRTEPRVTLFAPDATRAAAFGFGAAADLREGEVLLNTAAADELDAAAGDRLDLLVAGRRVAVVVAGVGRYEGLGATGSGVVMALPVVQDLLGHRGEVNHILVSNTGGITSGSRHTEVVERVLDEVLAPLGLSAEPAKRDGLDAADATGNSFVQLFTTFGTFSMAAGMLLIFLIFVMLAAERRPEMGMARAVGTQRRHLVQTFLFEGAVYDVAAALLGAVLGIGVSFVMVKVVGASFAAQDLDLTYSLAFQSLVIAYGLGVLLTLAVVTGSAWRVSRLNIVSAIRDLPEAGRRGRPRSRWLLLGSTVPLGLLLAVSGATSHTYLTWMLGLSLLTLSLVPVIRMVGGGERVAFTTAGGLLTLWWLLPFSVFDRLFGDMAMDFSVWIVGGLVIVVAATWVVTYNADIALGLLARLTTPIVSLRPVIRMAVAYPLRSRFRTGVTMAMFMLVVFTLVTGTVIPGAFIRAFDNVDSFGGGFDVRVSLAPSAATPDLLADLPADVAGDIEVDAAQSFVPIEAQQDGTARAFESYPLRGLDDAFLAHTGYGFSAVGVGYASGADVWAALRADAGLAVVDSLVAPRLANWGFGVLPAFQLTGFYVDQGAFIPVPVTVRDPSGGGIVHLKVIGVLTDDAPFSMAGITVSQAAMAPFGPRAAPTIHHLAVRPGADVRAVAQGVEAALLARGAEAETYSDVLDDAVGSSLLFMRLIQGFMALGLVVGVAALGVISARAVVERRQQLGMLRAIGFRPRMISQSLLAESTFVSLTAIVVGAALGLVVSFNVIADSRAQPGWSDVSFAVPWLNLLAIFAAVFLAAIATTYVPARRASHLYPAEALRYR